MITKSSLIQAVKTKLKKPIATISEPTWWPQTVQLNSSDVVDLKGKKVGDKVNFNAEGTIQSTSKGDRFTIEIQKVG